MPPRGPVLITGVAGFIGSHLAARLLGRGETVIGVDNFDPFYPRAIKQANLSRLGGRIQFHEADICDGPFMREWMARAQPAAVVHIAALAGVRPSIQAPARYAAVNIQGLVSVMQAMRAAGCTRLVFASSSSVYGNNAKAPFSEDDLVNEPISPYAATKRTGELLCATWARLWGLSIAALRFFTVFGPSQRPDLAIARFMRLIADGDPVPMFGDGSTSRDYTYIDDIIDGVVAALDSLPAASNAAQFSSPLGPGPKPQALPGSFRIYNLGNSHPVTLAEMIASIARVVGKPARIERLPMQTGDVERTFADISRATRELGYKPRVAFEEGLKRQLESLSAADRPSPVAAGARDVVSR